MLYAGEDPQFIARRIIIAASEDIGNADPHAYYKWRCQQHKQFILLVCPNVVLVLAQAVTYLCCAPKSNACYMGIEKAMQDVINVQIKSVPSHLKNCHYSGSKKEEGELNYQYPHDF